MNRDAAGRFLGDTWTSVHDIGRTYRQAVLTVAEYMRVESAYIEVALAFHEDASMPCLVARGVEGTPEALGVPGATVLDEALLRSEHCWFAADRVPGDPAATTWKRTARLRQAGWRAAWGHPIGTQPYGGGAKATLVGSRLPLEHAQRTGANLLTLAALGAVRPGLNWALRPRCQRRQRVTRAPTRVEFPVLRAGTGAARAPCGGPMRHSSSRLLVVLFAVTALSEARAHAGLAVGAGLGTAKVVGTGADGLALGVSTQARVGYSIGLPLLTVTPEVVFGWTRWGVDNADASAKSLRLLAGGRASLGGLVSPGAFVHLGYVRNATDGTLAGQELSTSQNGISFEVGGDLAVELSLVRVGVYVAYNRGSLGDTQVTSAGMTTTAKGKDDATSWIDTGVTASISF